MRRDGPYGGRDCPIRLVVRFGLMIVLSCLVLVTGSCTKKDEKAIDKAEVKSPAPHFALSDLKGTQVKLDEYKGMIVMVEFFTTWCAPCQMAAPEVQALYEKYKDRGFVVLGVTIEGRQEEALNSFTKQHSVTYPILIDDGATSRRYEVFSIPTSYLIDRQGVIISKHMGYNPDLPKALSREIEAHL
jgi:peroxiredoxin